MSVEMAIGDVMTILPLSIAPKEKISVAQQLNASFVLRK